jgi:hypothetical protein
MQEERMSKGLAVCILLAFTIVIIGIWAAFCGHLDELMVGELIFAGIVGVLAACGVVLLIVDAIRVLLR